MFTMQILLMWLHLFWLGLQHHTIGLSLRLYLVARESRNWKGKKIREIDKKLIKYKYKLFDVREIEWKLTFLKWYVLICFLKSLKS